MANFNKSILIGRLTTDPELKQTQSGVAVCSFSIAVNRRFAKDQVDFINCQAWRQQAEFLCKYFRKGSAVLVVGAIQTRNWTDQSGQQRYATEVVAEEINFVERKSDADNEASGSAGPYSPTVNNFEEMTADEDLPF